MPQTCIAGLLSCLNQPASQVAGQPGSRAAGQPCSRAAGQPGSRAAANTLFFGTNLMGTYLNGYLAQGNAIMPSLAYKHASYNCWQHEDKVPVSPSTRLAGAEYDRCQLPSIQRRCKRFDIYVAVAALWHDAR